LQQRTLGHWTLELLMIDSLLNLLFRCAHRRLTRPITPMSGPGKPSGETYVVCLDCGKQFAYEWSEMRIGKAIHTSPAKGVLPPDLPRPRSAKVKFALVGSALPLAVIIGNALRSKRNRKPAPPEPKP
jgi:hypothetical protein